MIKTRLAALVALFVLVWSSTPHALATNVTCSVDSGARNGSDSASALGFPGSDNPDGVDGSYSVSGSWHDSNEYEWCEPSHDWFKETYLQWSTAAAAKLTNERATHTIQVEQQVFPETSYNYAGGYSSNLPYNRIYVADIWSQTQQHFEEVSFMVDDPGLIGAGTNYYAYLQWDQEAENALNNTSPVLDHVTAVIEWGDKSYNVQNYDPIGTWSKKLPSNA